MRVPDYIGIGSIKSGTTWVADALATHPDVFMAHGKELHYFTDHYELGEQWYQDHFSGVKDEQAIGEFSVSYMDGTEQTARRIYDFNPRFRLLVAVRDPVERAFSHYRWLKQMGEALPSFRETLDLKPDLISIGRYAAALEPFWRLFPQDQFHYIRQSDIRERPSEVCRNLYRFLGVTPQFESPVSDQLVGQTIQPRLQTLEKLRIRTHQTLMNSGAGSLITLYKRMGLSTLYRRLNDDKPSQETLQDGDREALAPLFYQDQELFRETTGISLLDH